MSHHRHHRTACRAGAAIAFALAAPVFAQHADFVLFGKPNPEAAEQPASHRFVHPVSAPFFHEDAFVTSDVRAWFIYHDFPNPSLIDGGQAWAAAVQLRLALTDRLQFVAYKDGYVDIDTGLVDSDGLFDIGAGVKYAFVQDWKSNLHLAVGAGYQIRAGAGEVLQNDDEFRFWLSADKGFDALHLGATINTFFARGKDRGLGSSDRLSWHLHLDYRVNDWFSPVLEFNGYHVIDGGRKVLPFQGVDLANLGNGSSESVVTAAVGAEFRPAERLGLRFAYETPLTDADDLFGYRWTFSVVFSF